MKKEKTNSYVRTVYVHTYTYWCFLRYRDNNLFNDMGNAAAAQYSVDVSGTRARVAAACHPANVSAALKDDLLFFREPPLTSGMFAGG